MFDGLLFCVQDEGLHGSQSANDNAKILSMEDSKNKVTQDT